MADPQPEEPGRRVTVVGGTGLVGGHLVRLLAREHGVERVVAPVRRSFGEWADLEAVDAPLVDFARLEEHAAHFRTDQLFVCLGTTIRKAGSKDEFRRVDHDLVVAAAGLAVDGGARDAFLVSSVGADAASPVFYLRVKGEVEDAVRALPFESVYVLRPSLLTGDRQESRPLERIGMAFGALVAPLMVGPARRYRAVAAETVARAMVVLARSPEPGMHVYESDAIARVGGANGPGRGPGAA